jgi:hypothetical protein
MAKIMGLISKRYSSLSNSKNYMLSPHWVLCSFGAHRSTLGYLSASTAPPIVCSWQFVPLLEWSNMSKISLATSFPSKSLKPCWKPLMIALCHLTRSIIHKFNKPMGPTYLPKGSVSDLTAGDPLRKPDAKRTGGLRTAMNPPSTHNLVRW